MKVSASIELVMQLAGQETIAGKFKEVQPEHLCMALLKFSELPVEEVNKIAPGSEAARDLAVEVHAIREELTSRSVDSTRARRRLREQLGKGDGPPEDRQMHRSPASRELFDAAAKLADDSSSEVFAARHLLQALLASPTPAMAQVLGKAMGREPRRVGRSDTPFLDQHTYDLVEAASGAELSGLSNREVEARGLLGALAQKNRKGVVLVHDHLGAARETLLVAAKTLATGVGPPEMKGRRLLDLRLGRITGAKEALRSYEVGLKPLLPDQGYCPRCGAVRDPECNCYLHDDLGDCCEGCRNKGGTDILNILRAALAEAAIAKDVILVLPVIDMGRDEDSASGWANSLKAAFKDGKAQLIWSVSQATYHRWLAKDSGWRRLSQVVWVRQERQKEIPPEL